MRQVYSTLRESCYSLFQEIVADLRLDLEFTKSPLQINFPNGSKIIFRGLDSPQKLKSINNVSTAWIEECSEISYAGFKEILGRLRHPTLKLYLLLSTNPVSTQNWTYQHFFKLPQLDDFDLYDKKSLVKNNVYYNHSTCDDNKFLPADYLNQLEELKNYDGDLYRVARLGQFGVNGTRVLPQFEVKPLSEIMPIVEGIPRRYKFAGLDFGFVTSYNACVRVAADDKTLYIYWEWYEKDLTDDEIVSRLESFYKSREVLHCDSAEPKAIKYLQKNGINAVGCKKFAGSVLYNIRKLKRFHKIICAAECVNCVRELQDLTFKQDKDGNLIEDEFNIDSHCFDAVAYALEDYEVTDLKYRLKKSDLGL